MSFSLSGLASGIDTNTLIEQLMQIERQPVVRLENRKKSLASEQSFFRSLNTKLRTLQEAAADLTLSGTFRAMKAESSDKTVLGVKSQGTSVPGTYEITVHSLAKSHVVQSAERNADAEIGVSGTFYIHHESLESPLAIEVTGATYGEVMDEIVSQINSQSVGVKASVIETSNGNKRLILTAEHAGADHRIKMGEGVEGSAVVFEDTDGILSALGITSDADGEIAEQNVARPYTDAVISVNGVQVTRSSNTIDDVIPGVTLQLQKEGVANVTVDSDIEAITEAIEKFVKAYNDVVNTIRTNLAEGAGLQGDSMLRTLDSQLYSWVNNVVGGTEAGYQMLSFIGLTIDEGVTDRNLMTGTIKFDKERFQSKFNENPQAVIDLFMKNDEENGHYGIARLLHNNLREWTTAAGGILMSRIQGYDSQISLMDDRIEQMNLRLQMKEEQLRRQFIRMEIALAQQQSQMQWLSGQIAQLNANYKRD